jgi:pyrroline-5-carboxylate reductase
VTTNQLENFAPIAFIGAGAMSGAIVRGLLRADPKIGQRIRITGLGTPQMQELVDPYGVEGFDASTDKEANVKAIKGAGIVVPVLMRAAAMSSLAWEARNSKRRLT